MMANTIKYKEQELKTCLLEECGSSYGLKTYVSLFSSAGVGCYGFKEEGYYCVATVELLEKRLKIQKFNEKCWFDSGYICGDLTKDETKKAVFDQLDYWEKNFAVKDLDVLIATPPCQGMSVANHKKKDELKRNSLVVESIEITKRIKPKFFLFENVRSFLTSVCTDSDGKDKLIKESIDCNLAGKYNILYKVVNFKDYGNPSSRTRTLVIGVRKDIKEITPYDLFPDVRKERTLREVIGDLPPLKKMGQICENDIYHNFRSYAPHMEAWIADIKEGQSAFDNTDMTKIPHYIKNGVVVYNAQKNGDKYTRQCWDKVAPCIHTRNDIMASQNTVHPSDNRVFSIREVMRLMSVPPSFRWSDIPFETLNSLSDKEKQYFLKKEEMNIRQTLGEAVPTVIFEQIARKIKIAMAKSNSTEQDAAAIIKQNGLTDTAKMLAYIKKFNRPADFVSLSKIAETVNAEREHNAAFYTRQDICYAVIKNLPDAKGIQELNILEPSIGVGNFLPILANKYSDVPRVNIDVVDIDPNSIEILKELVILMQLPQNIHLTYITDDFLLHTFEHRYDIVIGNPPYMKITKDKKLLARYKQNIYNTKTNNIFAFFIEKVLKLGNVVALIVPKSLVSAPEFNATRSLMNKYCISHIIDFGEKGFKGVKIETISFVLNTQKKPSQTRVESYITGQVLDKSQEYVTDCSYPYWLLYRDIDFDKVAEKMQFNLFKSFRDRSITKTITKSKGRVRVLKSRNIGNNEIIDIPDYDCYIDDVSTLEVAKYMNHDCVLLPNLTYNPRACMLPADCIADGSVAILITANPNERITKDDLAYYATEEFSRFYAIARNRGTRSLNIDNNSVFFFGRLKQQVQ